jgi:hypothetical protein
MHYLITVVSPFLAGWLAAAILVGLTGGFDFIRRVDLSNGPERKTPIYWLTLVILYPIILLRAAIWAMWETMKGGAR